MKFYYIGRFLVATCVLVCVNAGCGSFEHRRDGIKVAATLRHAPTTNIGASDLILNIQNLGSKPLDIQTINGRFWGSVILRSRTQSFVLQDRSVWRATLGAYFIPDSVRISRGEQISFDLRLVQDFCTFDEFYEEQRHAGTKQDEHVELQWKRYLLEPCDMYCVSFDREIVSNVLLSERRR